MGAYHAPAIASKIYNYKGRRSNAKKATLLGNGLLTRLFWSHASYFQLYTRVVWTGPIDSEHHNPSPKNGLEATIRKHQAFHTKRPITCRSVGTLLFWEGRLLAG